MSGENQEGLMLFYGLLIFLVLVLVIMLVRTTCTTALCSDT